MSVGKTQSQKFDYSGLFHGREDDIFEPIGSKVQLYAVVFCTMESSIAAGSFGIFVGPMGSPRIWVLTGPCPVEVELQHVRVVKKEGLRCLSELIRGVAK